MRKTEIFFLPKMVAIAILVSVLQSCTLLKIESEATPLSKREMNTRLITQSFVVEASQKVELSADSIIRSSNNQNTQKAALSWKLNSLTSFRNTGFQTFPDLALMDTWILAKQMKSLFDLDQIRIAFGDQHQLAMGTVADNLENIENKAQNVLSGKDFLSKQTFVNNFAEQHPFTAMDFKYIPARESYLAFKKIPDSLAFNTVGTLSEVVADFANKISYSTENTGKQFRWNTELLMKENGVDSIAIRELFRNLESKMERLTLMAESSPEVLDSAVVNLSIEFQTLTQNLSTEMDRGMFYLSMERQSFDDIIKRERIAIDNMIERERTALAHEASSISSQVVKDVMAEAKGMLTNILLFLVIIFVVILFIPFVLGYYSGKIHQKNKNLQFHQN